MSTIARAKKKHQTTFHIVIYQQQAIFATMNTEIIGTLDGSFTLRNEYYGETYHSINGAVAESIHIFINLGLKLFERRDISILEIGYGTGLNAMLTFIENKSLGNKILYHGIEKYPIENEAFTKFVEYTSALAEITPEVATKFGEGWNEEIEISETFKLYKQKTDFCEFVPDRNYDLIYFDAFSPDTQPEMWTEENLRKIIDKLAPGGFFITYCSKGIVKQALRNIGMSVRRMPGPAGKRHVLQAQKNNQ